MTEFMKQELNRLVQSIPVTDPRTIEYHTLLRSIEYLDSMGETIEEILAEVFDGAEDSGAIELQPMPVIPFPRPEEPIPVDPPVVPPHEPANKPVTESTDSPAGEGEDTVEEPAENAEPERTWTAAEVRKAVVDARMQQGLDTKALFQKFGAATFQGIPASKYGEIMKELGVV